MSHPVIPHIVPVPVPWTSRVLLPVALVLPGIVLGLAAIILGILARSKYKKGTATNGTMAIVSIVLGAIAVVISAVVIVIGVGVFNQVGGSDFIDCMNNAGNNQTLQQQCADQFERNVDDQFGVTPGGY